MRLTERPVLRIISFPFALINPRHIGFFLGRGLST